jgi:hypothetical protein
MPCCNVKMEPVVPSRKRVLVDSRHLHTHGHNALPAAATADLNIQAGVIASINSYLGLLVHYSTVRLRCSMLTRVVPGWWAYLRVEGKAHKVV